jgi:hypothetical protein
MNAQLGVDAGFSMVGGQVDCSVHPQLRMALSTALLRIPEKYLRAQSGLLRSEVSRPREIRVEMLLRQRSLCCGANFT